jgi:putative ABC transport system permease protein
VGSLTWIAALLRRRPSRVLGAAAGVAIAVALLGSVGAFIASARSQMTQRAVRQVSVDWQVEVQPGGDLTAALDAVAKRPAVNVAIPVEFGQTSGFEATVDGTTQSTGTGVVVGLPPGYRRAFAAEIRTLAGADDGVLVAQQTAANLHAGPGDTITIGRAGQGPITAVVAGVVELPFADSLFQHVGAPAGTPATAPPDNVVFLPAAMWHVAFDAIATTRPDFVRDQVHVGLDHRLPVDPAAAYSRETGAARRLEADLSGSVVVGDNLGATLGAVRKDALYAQVLFILLGTPGAALAALLVGIVVSSSRDRRRRELALLRLRGGSLRQLSGFALVEAGAVGIVGSVVGLVGGLIIGHVAFGAAAFGATTAQSLSWGAVSALVGLLIAVVMVGVPARRDAAHVSVAAARRAVGHAAQPRTLRYGVDLLLLGASAIVFWANSRSHYALVLAPEGIPSVSVSYWALAGPLLLWVGSGLFAWRLADTVLGRGGRLLRASLRLVAGRLAGPVSASVRRQRRSLGAGIVLLALTVAFAISTSVFNATYRQQVAVDALLTNGAPVTVVEPPGARVPAREAARISNVAGVGHVEAVQHRFVYVGNDLQDLYGVDPATIGAAGKLQDAYFAGGRARDVMARLARQPDAVLVSDETVKDFQLHRGDRLGLRVRDASSGKLIEVAFRFAGIVKEFPTAPTDSFIVANASYVAQQTGDASPGTFLITNNGVRPRVLADRVRRAVGTGSTVADVETSQRVVGSSLTAVDLAGLTRVELGFAVALAVAAAGLVLGLGLAQRRRSFAIITALGARPRQVASFARAEAVALGVLGSVFGVAVGGLLAQMLVKVLTGVFDPPPARLAVPWVYLTAVGLAALAGLVAATGASTRATRLPGAEELRDL